MGFFSRKEVKIEGFNPDKKIGNFLFIDTTEEKWLVPMLNGKIPKNATIHTFDEILNFELLENGDSVSEGGIGRALVGGALFGGAGAVVGGVTGRKNKAVVNSLRIKITLKNIKDNVKYIDFIFMKTKKKSFMYKSAYDEAQKCLSTLQAICDQQDNPNNNELSASDEIKKYKNLLDDGAITQEEYDQKKKELLGL